MAFDMSDYVTVPERVARFYEKFPDGRICNSPPEVRVLGDRMFIEVTSSVYRSPDDHLPCVASAWEPFPGRTPYTKESEMMNAETSAVGRAISMTGIAVNRSLASAEEVRNRQAEREAPPQRHNSPVKRQKSKPEPIPDEQAPDAPRAKQEEIDKIVDRLNALQPAETRMKAKTDFAERFGHPAQLTSKSISDAEKFLAEVEPSA